MDGGISKKSTIRHVHEGQASPFETTTSEKRKINVTDGLYGQPATLPGFTGSAHSSSPALSIIIRRLLGFWFDVKQSIGADVGHRARRFVCKARERERFADL
jgi:hypothetical protein